MIDRELKLEKHSRVNRGGTAPRGSAKSGVADLDEKMLAPAVMLLATLLRRSAALVYRRELGLERNEWRVIAVVGIQGSLSHGALSEKLGLDKGQLSREVDALVKRGILMKERASRAVSIRLSERGEHVFRALTKRSRARNRHLLRGLEKKDRARLFFLLDLLNERANEAIRDAASD